MVIAMLTSPVAEVYSSHSEPTKRQDQLRDCIAMALTECLR